MTRDNVKVTTGPASALTPPVPAGWLVFPHASKVHLRCDSPHLMRTSPWVPVKLLDASEIR